MAGLLDTRLAREEASIFDDLYAAARQQEAALEQQGRRSVLGGLFSKEPVQGIDTVRFEGMPGLLSMLTPAAKAVDAPISAYRGLIPEQDMLGEALGTGGMAMGGGGVVAGRLPNGTVNANASKSAGLLAASLPDSLLGTPASTVKNMLRVYHGGPNKITDPEMRSDPEGTPLGFSVTPYRGVAEVYSKGKGEISSFDIDPQNANIITEMQLYDLIDSLERRLNLDEGEASESQISTALRDAGVDAVQYPDPEMGIRVVNPNILVATKEAKQ